ncbi:MULTISPECIES: hypothetical protein [unclassified Trinickia]|jgi:hypothetical protein|uniref:hypothetical protein n=1 Tax=unclassified Trinickia TaxID=2638168 RepID=UPI002406A5D5|nr:MULTISPECIES: hypothetical protein [unclassified Trinickia]MDG0026902.1 hypothetical protein [Trinickia sp. Y13]HVW53269.1 hypothetical protein [Trinickia sp.]
MKRLRMVVDKWLAPAPEASIRVERCAAGSQRKHRVRVQVDGPRGTTSLYFFRHDDGAWYVFPPEQSGITMRVRAA